MVVDASGRHTLLGRQLKLKRAALDPEAYFNKYVESNPGLSRAMKNARIWYEFIRL